MHRIQLFQAGAAAAVLLSAAVCLGNPMEPEFRRQDWSKFRHRSAAVDSEPAGRRFDLSWPVYRPVSSGGAGSRPGRPPVLPPQYRWSSPADRRHLGQQQRQRTAWPFRRRFVPQQQRLTWVYPSVEGTGARWQHNRPAARHQHYRDGQEGETLVNTDGGRTHRLDDSHKLSVVSGADTAAASSNVQPAQRDDTLSSVQVGASLAYPGRREANRGELRSSAASDNTIDIGDDVPRDQTVADVIFDTSVDLEAVERMQNGRGFRLEPEAVQYGGWTPIVV